MTILEKEIARAASPLQREKTGKNFQSLSLRLQNSIDENLIITEDMRRGLLENCSISDEWTTALRGENARLLQSMLTGKFVIPLRTRTRFFSGQTARRQRQTR